MTRGKMLISVVLLVVLTGLSLFRPAFTESLRAVVLSDMDYRGVFLQVGQWLSGDVEAAAQDPREPTGQEGACPVMRLPALEDVRAAEMARIRPVSVPAEALSEPTSPPSAEPETTENPVQEAEPPTAAEQALAVFLESQAAFSDYAVPENVSYSAEELPFACCTPVSGYRSSGFGYRNHPIAGEVKYHYGTDLAVSTGTPISAFADGTVIFAGEEPGYGLYVILEHAQGYRTLYAHCSQLLVQAGETVTCGTQIALSGATGQVTGPHLHFELMRDGVYLNPELYINSYEGV